MKERIPTLLTYNTLKPFTKSLENSDSMNKKIIRHTRITKYEV